MKNHSKTQEQRILAAMALRPQEMEMPGPEVANEDPPNPPPAGGRHYHVWRCEELRDTDRPKGKRLTPACGLWNVYNSKHAVPNGKMAPKCLCGRRARLSEHRKVETLDDRTQAENHASWLNQHHPSWVIYAVLWQGKMDGSKWDTPAYDADGVPNLAADVLYRNEMNEVLGVHRIIERHHKAEWIAREKECATWLSPGSTQLLMFEEEEE